MISLKRTGALFMTLAVLISSLSLTACKKGTETSGGKNKDKDKDKTTTTEPAPDSLSAFPIPPNADEYKSQNIYIINLDSNKEVWARNEEVRIDPASVTKVMTCLLALEKVKDLDTETATLTADINNYLYTQGVDTLGGIAMGESFSLRDLIYAMMLQSANDAAMMVGKYVSTKDPRAPEGGDLEIFSEMMNEKAKEIGAVNTHFSNATGLYDENNYSTAKDMALIAKYAWENPDYGETFQEIVTTNAYTSKPTNRAPDGLTWYSSIKPQQSSQASVYNPNVRGIKTGSLPERNIHNYVSAATRDGYTYLMAVCGAPMYDPETQEEYKYNFAFLDTKSLYEWVFNTFQVKTLINVGDPVTEVPVNLSWDQQFVELVAADKFASLVTTETTADSIRKEPVYPNAKTRLNEKKETEYYFDAPISKGDELGYVKITMANLDLGHVRLIASKSIERSSWLYYMSMAKEFMGNFVFKFLLAFVILAIVLYVLLMLIRNRNKKRYQMKRKPPRPPRRN